MARYDAEYKKRADEDRLALYTLDINRKFMIDGNKGGGCSATGICPTHLYPVLDFAMQVLGYEMPIKEAMDRLQIQLKAVAPKK